MGRVVTDKKRLCLRLVELLVFGGYDISNIAFKPLSHFNTEGVKKWIDELEKEQEITKD